jgi:putative CocE/NonD family hydrolase
MQDAMTAPIMREFVRHGYALAAVDVRGSGASFGRYTAPFSPTETQDAEQVMHWLATQPWCNGRLGMYGGSYLGAVQLRAATLGSPHLRAIVPTVAPGDLYAFCWAGGIYRADFLAGWSWLTRQLDRGGLAAPVDEDADGSLLEEATREHNQNLDSDELYRSLPFRDSVHSELELAVYPATSPLDQLEEIQRSGVAIYHMSGWLDCFTRDTLLLYANLANPQRIAIGPWFHSQRHEFDDVGEHLRWFDYWLKDIDNGIMQEPPVHYYVVGADAGERWRTADSWPVPAERERFFFLPGEGGASRGELDDEQPGEATLEYVVDETTSSGATNRWRNGYNGQVGYQDMAPNDEKAMCFTSDRLRVDREVVGHPVAVLWVSSTAEDGDFFVYLEEVEANGFSRYVTEGCLRASHRATHEAPYDVFGLPWHRSFAEDVQPLEPGVPVKLEIDLQPTAWLFDAGNRIRVSVTCSDHHNSETPIPDPPPKVSLYAGGERASFVELPFAR